MPTLQSRELKVATLAAEGYTNRDIAAKLEIAEHTVKNVIHSLFDKLGVWNRVELANYFAGPSVSPTEVATRIEAERMRVLNEFEILDSFPEPGFDEVARLASLLCDVPIAVLTLVDSDRVWFKAKTGLPFNQVSRGISICKEVILQSGPFIITDTLKDTRYAEHAMVKAAPRIRFYAALPLITSDGYGLGAICAIDRVPRTLQEPQLAALKSLAQVAMQQLEFRRNLLKLKDSVNALRQEVPAVAIHHLR